MGFDKEKTLNLQNKLRREGNFLDDILMQSKDNYGWMSIDKDGNTLHFDVEGNEIEAPEPLKINTQTITTDRD